jgi:pimeloyl-ACP methyl ester carboxylesterase/predicted glycosyltransferase
MRARQPDTVASVERDGVRVGYEVFEPLMGATADGGTVAPGCPTLVLLTSWAIVHMRQWKLQVPALARRFRVVTVEGRGNGAADRPRTAAAYADPELVADAVAVMDAAGVDRAVVIGLSMGGRHALQLAAWYPDRVAGVVAVGAALPWPLPPGFDEVRDTYEGWEKANEHYWRADYPGWVEFFMSRVFSEPHSTKPWEDGVGWGLDTDAETLLQTVPGIAEPDDAAAEEVCRRVRCPVLVVHGERDEVVPYAIGARLADWTGGNLVTVPDGGHAMPMRDPVRFTLLVAEFAESLGAPQARPRTWTPARSRRRRALFVSSAIGLGHALRDVAIADALRERHPDLEIDWLAQHPVTQVLADHGERVHPASRFLASESAHVEAEASAAGEHDLHAFQAIRRMDEILVANFHVFHDVVEDERHDLVVADEGWEIDHFLHENPELKRAAYAWLTDFVGWLPMPDGGAGEAALTADYNAEMVEQIARYPRLRDRSVFVGDPDDLVTDPLGPGLPTVRDWTQDHFAFAGYVTGFTPVDRQAVRAELGWAPDERICVVTAGGSGVGGPLLRRVVEAHPYATKQVPGLRTVVVTGPRLDPASVPAPAGVEVRGYEPGLYRLLAACDVAVVQGGLTTTMELTALRRPFLYFPLRHHFEQQVHVAHRLARHRAGTRMDYATATPEAIGEALAAALARPVDYRSVPTDGAARAAALIAELV